MTKPKLNPKPIGKYNRDSVVLVKRWAICLNIAKAFHRSRYTTEQLLLIKENQERDNLNIK